MGEGRLMGGYIVMIQVDRWVGWWIEGKVSEGMDEWEGISEMDKRTNRDK